MQNRKKSIKERAFSFIYRLIRAIVGLFVKTRIIRKRKLETVVVE